MFPIPTFRRALDLKLLKAGILLRNTTRSALNRINAHRGAARTIVIIAATIAVAIGARHVFPRGLSEVSKAIFRFSQSHPHLLRVLHVALFTIPDIAYVLLALAGLSYLLPDLTKKLEKTSAMRWIVFGVFVTFGIVTIVLNAVSREDQEHQRQLQETKMDGVRESVDAIQGRLASNRGQPNEAERRKQLLEALRDEYVISTPDAPATMLTGTSYPPNDWMNKRLRDLGEKWSFNELPKPPRVFGPLPSVAPNEQKAKVEFSFYSEDPDAFPIREMSIPQVGATIEVALTFRGLGEVTAKNGEIWIRICDHCIYGSEPKGFELPESSSTKDRRKHFDVIYPNVPIDPITFTIVPPLFKSVNVIWVAGYYSCENCPPVDPKQPQVLHARIIRPK